MSGNGDKVPMTPKQSLARIGQLATELADLIQPGTTIQVNVPAKGKILTPGKALQKSIVIITRPNTFVGISMSR